MFPSSGDGATSRGCGASSMPPSRNSTEKAPQWELCGIPCVAEKAVMSYWFTKAAPCSLAQIGPRCHPYGSMGRSPMKGWTSVAAVMIALTSIPDCAAQGVDGCGAIRLGETAIAMVRNEPIVRVFADGAALTLLLDTGAEATVLTPAAAQRIGAQRSGVELGRQVHGITGDVTAGELELRSFMIGGVEAQRRRVRVAPIEIVNDATGPLDGVLGADTLSSFDIDLDLPGRRVTLYREQGCAAATPAWAPPYARIAAGRSPSNRLYFPAQIDGRTISVLPNTLS